MHDYDNEKWFDLYKTALLELQRAAMTGRIANARAKITTRLETLQQHPELHQTELSAIEDAVNNLRVLEREEERVAAEDNKRILHQTVQKLKTIAPKLGEPEQQRLKSNKEGRNTMVTNKTTVELTDPEFMILIQLLVEHLQKKARSGIDTNGLPETALNVKLINARNEIVGHQ